MKFYSLEISAENKAQADDILNALLKRRLVTGGQFIQTPSRFLWKDEIIDINYVTFTSFTIENNKKKIIDTVERTSKEDVPMIRFIEFEGNQKLLTWITDTLISD